jgi:hypothetical protein
MTRMLSAGQINLRLFLCVTLFASTKLGAQVTPGAPPAAPVDTSYVTADEGPLSLPLGIGIRTPSYDRVDGLVLPWGPEISLANNRVRIDPTATYRSNLGKIDPFVLMSFGPINGVELTIEGGRGTFTNDGWIRSDVVNSLTTIGVGSDSRNYFRADRGLAALSKVIGRGALIVTPSIGARFENDWSTGIPIRHTNAPWSFFGRTDSLKMTRPNPAVDKGHLASAIGGVQTQYTTEDVTGSLDIFAERSFHEPPDPESDESGSDHFAQITIDSRVGFLTFGTQRFDFRGHGVLTPGYNAPPQRFSYLGGAGTLATVDLLALGGDRLFYAEGEYSIPFDRIAVPLLGNLVASVRYAAGAAGVGKLPDFIQNIGVGLGVRYLKAEYHIDPNYKPTSFTHRHAFSIGISL